MKLFFPSIAAMLLIAAIFLAHGVEEVTMRDRQLEEFCSLCQGPIPADSSARWATSEGEEVCSRLCLILADDPEAESEEGEEVADATYPLSG